ncbi:MAG: transposase [Armatimonadetes bacterium]|nr:transposase [Armatimonadota bacterium]
MRSGIRLHRHRREELERARPGIIMAQHSWGDDLHFHPHWHLCISDGVFSQHGDFFPLFDWQPEVLREALRCSIINIIKAFVRRQKLTPDAADVLAGWDPDRSGSASSSAR